MNGALSDVQKKIWEALSELDGETVLNLLTDYHGTQLLTAGFYEFLKEEGVV